MKKRYWFSLLLIAVMAWGFFENTQLQINSFPVNGYGLPENFNGFRIAHISDLHNTEFGNENQNLLQLLEDTQPDIIAITGDLVDSRRTDLDIAVHFAEEAVKIAPCYYVPGNHESRLSAYAQLEQQLTEAGVVILANQSVPLERGGQQITIAGVEDPAFSGSEPFSQTLSDLSSEDYTILLSHRPEYFDLYCQNGFSLILSGHIHGGQFRLPFLGGLLAPGQGFFPEYDSGLYTSGNTSMVVSRGLGNSLFPFRLNNPPEIILITLIK